jgi:STIP1 family protein 1
MKNNFQLMYDDSL